MITDNDLVQIMATKSNSVYQAWLQDRKNNTQVFDVPKDEAEKRKFLLDKKNLRISYMIDSLNEKIRG